MGDKLPGAKGGGGNFLGGNFLDTQTQKINFIEITFNDRAI